MATSRTTAFLRNASSNPYTNNLTTIAKKAGGDVVDQLVNHKRARRSEDDSTSWTLGDALQFDEFGTDMGDFAPGGFMSSEFDMENVSASVFDNDLDSFSPTSFLDAPTSSAGTTSSGFGIGMRTPAHNNLGTSNESFGLSLLPSPRPTLTETVCAVSPVKPVKVKIEEARRIRPSLVEVKPQLQSTTDEDLEEREFEARLVAASSSGDMAAVRQIKNGREKVRRAKMCNKFQELHDVIHITNKMMALSATGVASPLTAAAAAVAAQNAASEARESTRAGKAKSAGYEKKHKFKKAQVLHNAIKTIKEMQAQIEALAQENAGLKKRVSSTF